MGRRISKGKQMWHNGGGKSLNQPKPLRRSCWVQIAPQDSLAERIAPSIVPQNFLRHLTSTIYLKVYPGGRHSYAVSKSSPQFDHMNALRSTQRRTYFERRTPDLEMQSLFNAIRLVSQIFVPLQQSFFYIYSPSHF